MIRIWCDSFFSTHFIFSLNWILLTKYYHIKTSFRVITTLSPLINEELFLNRKRGSRMIIPMSGMQSCRFSVNERKKLPITAAKRIQPNKSLYAFNGTCCIYAVMYCTHCTHFTNQRPVRVSCGLLHTGKYSRSAISQCQKTGARQHMQIYLYIMQ